MARRKMSNVNRFKQSLTTKQGKGVLLIVAVAVLLLFGSTAFSAFDSSKVTVGVTAKVSTIVLPGATVDESAMAVEGSSLYFMLYGYAFDTYEVVGVPTHADSSDSKLVCTDNDAVVGEGTAGKIVTRVSDPETPFYEVIPYFKINVSGVYKETYSYKIVVTGSVIGESPTFEIIGDADSPVYSVDDDDDGDDNETIPTLPTFTAKPADAIDMLANETRTFFWNVTDDNPSQYALYQNETLVQTGLVTTEVFSYPLTLANFTDGVYAFTFEFVDADGNEISHTTIITVSGSFGFEKWIADNPMMAMVLLIGGLMLFGGGGGAYVIQTRR